MLEMPVRVIAWKTLREFGKSHADAHEALRAWFSEAESAKWSAPQDIKHRFSSASFIGDDRVVFNLKGNTYRLIVKIRYDFGFIYIRFIGTHAQYDRIDAKSI